VKGKVLVIGAVLALVVPTAVSAKIGTSNGKAPASSKTILAPVAQSPSVANSSRAAQHDGTCLSRASMYEL
jgi:hypothetical protein